MLTSLPVPGWESEQVTYQHLIRPVVAFVRDHGPVPVARVCDYIDTTAAGDLNFASPTKDRRDAARRTLNLLVQDLDVLVVTDDVISAPSDLTVVHSAQFGSREIRSQDVLDAEREASRRQRILREWASRGLFHGKWHNGIRRYSTSEVEWMAEQIRQYGYVGPKIVQDAETGAILNGGLRAAALELLDMPVGDHSETLTFANDLHRLAFILAAHTVPGGKTRVPHSLRDAILKDILPRGEGVLRTKDGRLIEPSPEDWLAITGGDFAERAVPASTPEGAVAGEKSTKSEQIQSVMGDEWCGYDPVIKRIADLGYSTTRIERTMRDMAAEGLLYSRDMGGRVEFRRRLGPVSHKEPVIAVTPPLKGQAPKGGAPKVGMDILVQEALVDPERWVEGWDLDDRVTHVMGGPKKRAANQLMRNDRGPITFFVHEERWRPESKKEGSRTWLRAVKV